MTNEQKTIVSIVTPLGEGGIGKLVVSGSDALSIVNSVFQGKGTADLREAASQKLYYGHIHDKGQRIDEVIVHITKREDSFTGEDVVEVNCHGGIRVLMRVYECLQLSGAKGVEWDLLLSQSVENDKIDFIQKEALREVVRARTKLGVKVLLDQYAGALSVALKQGLEIIEGIRRSLRKEGLYNDGMVRPDPLSSKETMKGKDGRLHQNDSSVSALTEHIGGLLKTASLGMALTTPQVLIILGKPNVGKSTIINTILGEERMLVHHEPGTTRDYVSEFISAEGIPFELVDTAGVRETSDLLEIMSIEMTQEQLRRADRIIAVFDNSRNFDREDAEILKSLNSWLMSKNSGGLNPTDTGYKIIPVVNKCDLPAKFDRLRVESCLQQPVCCISALNKKGFEDLNTRLLGGLDIVYQPMRPVVFHKRQYLLLARADALMKQERDCLVIKNVSDRTFRIIDELKDILTTCLEGS